MDTTGHTDNARGELEEPQAGPSSRNPNPGLNSFMPAWLPPTVRSDHKSLKAHVSITTPKQWKSPYSSPYITRDERHFGTPRRKISATEGAPLVATERATSESLGATTTTDCRSLAKTRRIRGQRYKTYESSSRSQVTSKVLLSPKTRSLSPAKRPRTPLRVGQLPLKNGALGKTFGENLRGNTDVGTSGGIQSERPSAKKRRTFPSSGSQMKGRKTAFRPFPPYRRRANIERHAPQSEREPGEVHLRASHRRAAPTESAGFDKSPVGNHECWDFEFEDLGEGGLESITEATSKLVGRVPRSEILRILGDIEEMAERYTELLGSPFTESPSGKSREEAMVEIERCRDTAFGQLLGLCSGDNQAKQHAILLRRQGHTYETPDSGWRNQVAGATQRLEGLKSLTGAPNFSAAGTRQRGNGGSAEGGKAAVDERDIPDLVLGDNPVDMGYQMKGNREDGSDSGSDRERGTFSGMPQSKHYFEDSDEDESEEPVKLLPNKGKGKVTNENEPTPMASSTSSPRSTRGRKIPTNCDGEVQEDSHAHQSTFPRDIAEAMPEHASPLGGMLDVGVSPSKTSDRLRPQHHRSPRHSAKWRRDGSRQRSLSSRSRGILKRGQSRTRESPKRVKNLGRRNSQAETEVATVTYLPESAPAASRTLRIPIGDGDGEDLLSVVIDVPSPTPRSKTQPLGSGPDEQVETLSHLTGDPGSAKPGPLYDKSDRIAERRLIRKTFRRRYQKDGNTAGTSRSTIRARLRGVRNAKFLGRPVIPGEGENPALFDSDLDELGSDAATTKILNSGSYDDAEWESESENDDDSEYSHGYRVRSLLTPFVTDDKKKRPPRHRPKSPDSSKASTWTYHNTSNPGGMITGLGQPAVVDTYIPESMMTQQGGYSPSGTPSTWTGHGQARPSKSKSPIEAAKRGLSGMFGSVTRSPPNASDGPNTGSLRRKMKKLLLKPLNAGTPAESEPLIRRRGTSLASSSRTSPTRSPSLGSTYPPSRTSAESSQAPQFTPTPTFLWDTSTQTRSVCAPDCGWTHRHKRCASPAPQPAGNE
ncbi:MAG: hypothetical protein M1839_000959 [Geoglossum umbratile]|nr:MAG: hypothetical protein M1839_000959 [Geoglossum umbratile]